MNDDQVLRAQLSRLLEKSDAHTGFDEAVSGIEPAMRGVRPERLTHSAWELVEHIRIAQRDILDFCLPAEYVERAWPDEYWPEGPEPPSAEAWEEAIAAIHADRSEFQRLVEDPEIDLTAVVPHGTTQTYLREVLVEADHMAFHLGQVLTVKRLVGGLA